MQTETLIRYTNRDGARRVTLTVLDDGDRPYSLSDEPAEANSPGTYFLLDSHATREAAQDAAEEHADAAIEHGTFEARAMRVFA
jgi:hypothetical protein